MVKDILARILAIMGFLSFGIYDAVTTAVVAARMGFANETSGVLRVVGMSTGITGATAIKVIGTVAAMLISIYVAEHYPPLKHTAYGCMIGGILAGLYAGTSNLNILWNGSSFYLFGLDGQVVAIAIIVVCCACGVLIDTTNLFGTSHCSSIILSFSPHLL